MNANNNLKKLKSCSKFLFPQGIYKLSYPTNPISKI